MEDGKYPALYELLGGVPVNDLGERGLKAFYQIFAKANF